MGIVELYNLSPLRPLIEAGFSPTGNAVTDSAISLRDRLVTAQRTGGLRPPANRCVPSGDDLANLATCYCFINFSHLAER